MIGATSSDVFFLVLHYLHIFQSGTNPILLGVMAALGSKGG